MVFFGCYQYDLIIIELSPVSFGDSQNLFHRSRSRHHFQPTVIAKRFHSARNRGFLDLPSTLTIVCHLPQIIGRHKQFINTKSPSVTNIATLYNQPARKLDRLIFQKGSRWGDLHFLHRFHACNCKAAEQVAEP